MSAAVESAATSEPPAQETDAAAPANPKKRKAADDGEPPTAPLASELALPLGSIMRIVKAKLPEGMLVGTETKKHLSKACSLFILYLSTIAADVAKENNRATVSAADVLTALRDLEFDDFLLPVEASLAGFREAEKAKSIQNAAKRAANLAKNPPAAKEADEADEAEEEEAPDSAQKEAQAK